MNNGQAVGTAGPFELIRGKVHGEIDPKDPHNTIIQDLDLAPRNARGKVEYVATFALAKPVDMSKAARVLLYQVVNRGNGQAVASPEGYMSLVSGWQGDVIPTATNQTIVVPIATQSGRLGDHRFRHRALLRRTRRDENGANPSRLARHGAAVSPRQSRTARCTPDVAHTRELFRRAGRRASRRTRRLGASPTASRRRGPARPTRRASA